MDAVRYDPAEIAAVTVACLAAMGVMFWVLWAAVVYRGPVWVNLLAAGIGVWMAIRFYRWRLRPISRQREREKLL